MNWADRAAHALTDTFSGSFDAGGVVVAAAAIDAHHTSIASDPVGLAADQRFEIGSVTKTMTATMLALLAVQGTLSLDDEIGRWLSAGPHGSITVRELATHTSGLPALAPNRRARQADPADPWAGYTFDLAEAGLRESVAAPGQPWRYSNLGYQLLGLILERASGRDYAALLAENLFEPLSMAGTGVGGRSGVASSSAGGTGSSATGSTTGSATGSSIGGSSGGPGSNGRRGDGVLLPGHAAGREVPAWSHPLGAGGVESTVTDMARYARACLFRPDTLLGKAIGLAQNPVSPVTDGVEQALAWAVYDGTVCEHSGGTGGFSASVSIDHGRARAVVLLVSYGGSVALSTHLKQAARLVLADEDPRQATRPQPWPSWREDACDVARALLDGKAAQVHARLTPEMRRRVTAEQLERAWTGKTEDAGAAGRISVAHHEIAANGAVVADISIEFDKGLRCLRVVVLPSGEFGGLAFVQCR
jgi:serine-type D-Ala-D-Ala carboxypeptidase/endopeptidase